MKISVIIPIYDKLTLTIQCIESIEKYSAFFREMEVIVVDDGPGDEAAEHFSNFTEKNKWLRYHKNPVNLKFAGTCNKGAVMATGKYLIFLNNDTEVTHNWDKYLLETIEKDRDIWMVGAKLLYPDGTLQHAGVYLPELTGQSFGHVYRTFPADFPPANFEKELQCVTAACIMVRREDFISLEGFDTAFLNGSEDIDLCLRVVEQGKKIIYQPQCVVTHFESVSQGRFSYSKQNAERLAGKWQGKAQAYFRERVEADIRNCINLGLMEKVHSYSAETGWAGFGAGNPNLELIGEEITIALPAEIQQIQNDLFIWMECVASDHATIKLIYAPGAGSGEKLYKVQYLRPGVNQVLFSLGNDILPESLEFVFSGQRASIQFLSLSIYLFMKESAKVNLANSGNVWKTILEFFRLKKS